VKIFRHLDQAGKMGFGRFDEEGKTYLIVQKPDGSFEATDQAITPFQLLTPIDFRCIYAVGHNYREHAQETGAEVPKHPVIFMKAPTAVQNPGDPIVIPRFLRSDKVDYEGELGVMSVPGTGKKRRGVVSFAGAKALIPFVRWAHAWSPRTNCPIHRILPFVLL
jgi:2-keto-4-pentenoate hydratase/2-oxohepta-3-ene-1,7-dioic acid hydratase in catechol pathway